MASFLSRTLRITAVVSLPAALMVMGIPSSPALAGNSFQTCVSRLQNSGILPENASTACADALIPKDLSTCVQNIQSRTEIPAENALDACYKTRRPTELASCVTNINRILPSEVASNEDVLVAVDTCRRSVLPERHAQCVVGLSKAVQELSPVDAMNTCVSAEDFPRDLFPAYVE